MKARVEIPKGWRHLRCGAQVAKGDRLLDREALEWFTPFEFGYKSDDDRAVGDFIGPDDYVIRKILL